MRYNRTSKQVLISVVIAVAFVALALMTGTRRVNANTFTVSNLSDSGMGSLRQAILDANANPGADTINFQAGLTGTIQLTMGPLTINDPTLGALTMNGPGAQVLTVSGEGVSRVFSIAPGNTVTLDGLTLSNGSDFFGGSGIFNQGTLTITNSTISGNSATNGFGGGIWNQGTLTITNSTISGNSATSGTGGGIFNQGTLTITNSTISGNSTNAGGGGIANVGGGTLTITSSTISGNSAPTVNGGGIFNLNIATFKNSIIANSPSGGNCGGVAIAPVGVNFSTDNTCAGFTVVPSTGA